MCVLILRAGTITGVEHAVEFLLMRLSMARLVVLLDKKLREERPDALLVDLHAIAGMRRREIDLARAWSTRISLTKQMSRALG
jgi:hypothetical protein